MFECLVVINDRSSQCCLVPVVEYFPQTDTSPSALIRPLLGCYFEQVGLFIDRVTHLIFGYDVYAVLSEIWYRFNRFLRFIGVLKIYSNLIGSTQHTLTKRQVGHIVIKQITVMSCYDVTSHVI